MAPQDAHAPHDGIELAPDAVDNGLANMLSELLRQNLVDRPEKRRDFEKLVGRVAIVAEDVGVSLTMRFSGGHVVVHDGIVGIPDVTVRADGDAIMQMSLVELDGRFRLPDPRREGTKALFAMQSKGRVHTYGTLMNIPLLIRLTRLMSIY